MTRYILCVVSLMLLLGCNDNDGGLIDTRADSVFLKAAQRFCAQCGGVARGFIGKGIGYPGEVDYKVVCVDGTEVGGNMSMGGELMLESCK